MFSDEKAVRSTQERPFSGHTSQWTGHSHIRHQQFTHHWPMTMLELGLLSPVHWSSPVLPPCFCHQALILADRKGTWTSIKWEWWPLVYWIVVKARNLYNIPLHWSPYPSFSFLCSPARISVTSWRRLLQPSKLILNIVPGFSEGEGRGRFFPLLVHLGSQVIKLTLDNLTGWNNQI